MSVLFSPPFSGLGQPALAMGSARYFRVDATAFPSTGFVFSCRVLPQGSGPLMFYGSWNNGGLPVTYVRIWADTTITVEIARQQLVGKVPVQDGRNHFVAVGVTVTPGSNEAHVTIAVDADTDVSGTIPLNAPVPLLPTSGPIYIGAEPPKGGDNLSAPRTMQTGPITDARIWSVTNNQPFADANISGSEFGLWGGWPMDVTHLSYATSEAIDLSPAKRHAHWVTNPLQPPTFGVLDNFAQFPVANRTVTMWVRGGQGAGTLLSYGDLARSDHPNSGGSGWRIAATLAPSDGLWHHVAVVSDTASSKMYSFLDGERTGLTWPLGGAQVPGQKLLIGAQRESNDDGEVFTGQIRDVWLWSNVRSDDDIGNDADSVPADSLAGLVARWPLDPRYPEMDASGNVHHLRITGASAPTGTETSPHSPNFVKVSTTIDGRPCDVVFSDAEDLVLHSTGTRQLLGPSVHIPDPTRDLVVVAKQVTVNGYVSLAGRRIRIYAGRLFTGTDINSQPALSVDGYGGNEPGIDPAGPFNAGTIVLQVSSLASPVVMQLRANGGEALGEGARGGNGGSITTSILAVEAGSVPFTTTVLAGQATFPELAGAVGTVTVKPPVASMDPTARILRHLFFRAADLADDIIQNAYDDTVPTD